MHAGIEGFGVAKKVYFLCKVYLSVRRISRYTMVTVIFTDAVYRVFC